MKPRFSARRESWRWRAKLAPLPPEPWRTSRKGARSDGLPASDVGTTLPSGSSPLGCDGAPVPTSVRGSGSGSGWAGVAAEPLVDALGGEFRLPADPGVRWESAGEGDYTLEAIDKPARGTVITLHLREGEDDFLSGWKLRQTVRTYSDHITLPIRMNKEKWDEEKKEQGETPQREERRWTTEIENTKETEQEDIKPKSFFDKFKF